MVAASPKGEIGTEEWETTPFVIEALVFCFKRSGKSITNIMQEQRSQAKSKEAYALARIIILSLENCFTINSLQDAFSLHGYLFPLNKRFNGQLYFQAPLFGGIYFSLPSPLESP